MKARRKSQIRYKVVAGNCPFCKSAGKPDYKNYSELAKFVSDRAKILARSRSGVCAKHQRKLANEIKKSSSFGASSVFG